MNTYVHIYIRIYTHTYIPTHTRTCIHTLVSDTLQMQLMWIWGGYGQ